jgi:oxygen-independent coproporphyrinogen-3 oxidase
MKEKVLKYNGQVPRYTSYPTAPHFTGMTPEVYAANLKTIGAEDAVSIYVHIPFCTEMC